MAKIEIVIPQYITHVKLSEKRRRIIYDSSTTPDRFYVKSISGKITSILNKEYEFKGGQLYDKVKKDFVTKNAKSVGTPKYHSIAGNIHMRSPGFVQTKTTDAIQNQVLESAKEFLLNNFHFDGPVKISCKIYTTPRHTDWDLSNLWIYFKSFEDAIIDKYKKDTQEIESVRLLRNDNIRHITSSGQYEFFPISHEEDRKMIYTIESDERPEITGHVLYGGIPTINYLINEMTGKAGDIITFEDAEQFMVSFRKKGEVVSGAVKDVLKKIYWECVRLNIGIQISEEMFHILDKFMDDSIRRITSKDYFQKFG